MESRTQSVLKPSSFDFEEFEPKLRSRVAQELTKTDFDHTLTVVKNMKRFVSMEGGKLDVLVAASYLHEIGKGDKAVILSHELEEKSPLVQRYAACALRAKEILVALKFPEEKAEEVARYLTKNECVELKRAHHSMY